MMLEDIPDSATALSASPLDLRKRLGESALAPSTLIKMMCLTPAFRDASTTDTVAATFAVS